MLNFKPVVQRTPIRYRFFYQMTQEFTPKARKEQKMRITQWAPFQELAEFERRVDRMLGRTNKQNSYGYPPIDLVDNGETFLIVAFLPGIDLEQLSLSVLERTVTLTGSREPAVIEGGKPIYRERLYGQFQKRIDLPHPVREDEVNAEYTDGILRVTLPKSRTAGPRRIAVK
jgi:HSP20 family protein